MFNRFIILLSLAFQGLYAAEFEQHKVSEALNGSTPSDILLSPTNAEEAKRNWDILRDVWHPFNNLNFNDYAAKVTDAIDKAYSEYTGKKMGRETSLMGLLNMEGRVTAAEIKKNKDMAYDKLKESKKAKEKKEAKESEAQKEHQEENKVKLVSKEGQSFFLPRAAAQQLQPIANMMKANPNQPEYPLEDIQSNQLRIIVSLLSQWYEKYQNKFSSTKAPDTMLLNQIYDSLKPEFAELGSLEESLKEKLKLYKVADFLRYQPLKELAIKSLYEHFKILKSWKLAKTFFEQELSKVFPGSDSASLKNKFKKYFATLLLAENKEDALFFKGLINYGVACGVLIINDTQKYKALEIKLDNLQLTDAYLRGLGEFLEFLSVPSEFGSPLGYTFSDYKIYLNLADNLITQFDQESVIPDSRLFNFTFNKNHVSKINLSNNRLTDANKEKLKKLLTRNGVEYTL